MPRRRPDVDGRPRHGTELGLSRDHRRRCSTVSTSTSSRGRFRAGPRMRAILMSSYATLVEEMAEVAPLAVDLVPWLVNDHREMISHIVRQCDSVTVLAYRDRAAAILAEADGMLASLRDGGHPLPHRCRDTATAVVHTDVHDVRRRRRGGDAQGAQRCRRPAFGRRCSTGSPSTTSTRGDDAA